MIRSELYSRHLCLVSLSSVLALSSPALLSPRPRGDEPMDPPLAKDCGHRLVLAGPSCRAVLLVFASLLPETKYVFRSEHDSLLLS